MQIQNQEIIIFLVLTTLAFLIAPIFVLVYIKKYNSRKQKDYLEQLHLKERFSQELLQTRMEVQEQTLQTLAADLHDNVGQLLSLTAATLEVSEGEGENDLKERLQSGHDLVIKSIQEIRELSKMMNGTSLLKKGLENAMAIELEYIRKTKLFLVDFAYTKQSEFHRPGDIDLIIFRIFQEIMNNIIKHSKAEKVALRVADEPTQFLLIVKDNGIGFDYENTLTQQGLGLSNIEKRVSLLSGEVEFQKLDPNGTMVTLKIPFPHE